MTRTKQEVHPWVLGDYLDGGRAVVTRQFIARILRYKPVDRSSSEAAHHTSALYKLQSRVPNAAPLFELSIVRDHGGTGQ